MSFAKRLREIEDEKLWTDMVAEADRNRLQLTQLLKEITKLNEQGVRQTFLQQGGNGYWKTLGSLLAIGAQLRVEGFVVTVLKDHFGKAYLKVSW